MTGEVAGYVLREVLGEGAGATVWRAEVEGHPGRIVAVKRLRGPVRASDVADLRREAAALERLSHPSILRLLDVVSDGDGIALVVPLATGGSLASRIAIADAGLTLTAVADLGARLAGALAAAHNAGLVHRDVKPANVLFDAEGQPLLADFGTARLRSDDRATTAGTAEYLDPELLSGPPDVASDVYGLGVTLYEALAGAPPYGGSTPEATLRAADRGRHAPLGDLVDVPPTLAGVVERAISRDPTARPDTAARLAGLLDEARRELEAPGDHPTVPHRSRASSASAAAPHAAGQPAAPSLPDTGPSTTPGLGPSKTPDDDATPLLLGPGASRSDALTPGARAGTRRFGPTPPRPAPATPARRPRVDHRLLIAAAVLALVVPLGVVWWLAGNEGARGDEASPIGSTEGSEEATAEEGMSGRTAPPRCDDVPAPDPADDAEVLDADVDARGCSVPVAWDGAQLLVPRPDGPHRRYDLDAQADDHLLVGDWTCDGHDTPALYRPMTGQLFLFDGFAERDEEVTGRVEETGVRGGEPRVLTDGGDCDHVEVVPT